MRLINSVWGFAAVLLTIPPTAVAHLAGFVVGVTIQAAKNGYRSGRKLWGRS